MSDTNIDMPVVIAPGDEGIDEHELMIRKNQAVRDLIITALTPGGVIPKDKEDRAFLLAALDGASRTALSAKRIRSDEKQAESQEALAEAIASGAARIMNNYPVRPQAAGTTLVPVEVKMVPGLTYIGVEPVHTEKILNDESIIAGR